jgi:hypothetical protein
MSKFIEGYQFLFPKSPLLLILSPANQFMLPDVKRQEIMLPAYAMFKSLDILPHNTLLHSFSNGGINALRTFTSLVPGGEFPARVLVVDSAPGRSSLSRAMRAFTMDVRSPLRKFLLQTVILVLYIGNLFSEWLLRKENRILTIRRYLTTGGAVGPGTRRLYLYSDADDLVQKESVESHVREMKDLGYNVRSRNFGSTRHVGHMRANPELYWQEVLGVWKDYTEGGNNFA